jgi:hypothetical protein
MVKFRGLLLISFLVMAHCNRPPDSPQKLSKPQILLVTLDTTRADRIGVEDPQSITSNLDAPVGVASLPLCSRSS